MNKQREEEHEEQVNRILSDPRILRQQHLQEDVARMAIIEKDIDQLAKRLVMWRK